MLTTCCYLFC